MKTRISGFMLTCIKRKLVIAATCLPLAIAACTFQPLYSSPQGNLGTSNLALSSISVADVYTREAQQVRNHLIFLLSEGVTPINPGHELRLRVSSTSKELPAAAGNSAGTVTLTVSYELYDFTKKSIVHQGKRSATASYDRTSQSFANLRAERDAANRAAKAVAEQLRLAIASDLGSG